MLYITSVKEGNLTKHVINCGEGNVFITEGHIVLYGNKKGEKVFIANGVKVSNDLTVTLESNDFIHLAQIVLAVEQVRFILNTTHKGIKV